MINLHTTASHQPAALAATGDTAMTNTTNTAARSFYAVYSPRGFANEITVVEYDNAQQAKERDAGYAQPARARYIREYRRRKAQGALVTDDYLRDPRTGYRLPGVIGMAHIND